MLVHGRLQQDQWQDKDGNKRSKLKVVVEHLVLLPRTGSDQAPGPAGDAPAAATGPTTSHDPHLAGNPDDEPPF